MAQAELRERKPEPNFADDFEAWYIRCLLRMERDERAKEREADTNANSA